MEWKKKKKKRKSNAEKPNIKSNTITTNIVWQNNHLIGKTKMPTILINTNLIKSTSAVKTGECCGGNDEEQQRQCIDEEFRQDLNEIIKKLLVKSETVKTSTLLHFVC